MSLSVIDTDAPADTPREQISGAPFDQGVDGQRPDPLAAEVASCLPVMRALSRQLTEVIRQVETSVVDVCQSFSGIAGRARQSVDDSAQYLLTSNKSSQHSGFGGLVNQTRETMNKLLSGIESSSRTSVRAAERMSTITARIDEMRVSLRTMDTIAERARFLALNAKIEAARLGDRGSTFTVLASETAELSQRTAQAGETLEGIVGDLQSTAVATADELRELAAADLESASTSQREAGALLDLMTATNEQMQDLLRRSHESSRGLAGDISRAVTTLQFQDAVSQRVSHVVETIEEIDHTLETRLGGPAAATRLVEEAPEANRVWVDRMTTRYTMAAEHAALDGQAADASGIGNNVELF